MDRRFAPKHDAPVAAAPDQAPAIVLVQILPSRRVLAISHDEGLLRREAAALAAILNRDGVTFRWFVQKAAVHLT